MSFINLRTSILRHTDTVNHQKKYVSLKNVEKEERADVEMAKQCGINCAASAFTTTTYWSESFTSYEHHITDIYNCAGIIGIKNLAECFQTSSCHIMSCIQVLIITNKLPFGILADKMTSKHLTRHMVGIRIPIWDT